MARRWLSFWLAAVHLFCFLDAGRADGNSTHYDEEPAKKHRGLLAPRMDYEQWKPLGRGDPLKNDPTYDYVPPVLERVHYWIESPLRKPDAPPQQAAENRKTEILLLGGVSMKKSNNVSKSPSPGHNHHHHHHHHYDPFMKFVEGPKFSQVQQQKQSRPHLSIPVGYFPGFFSSSPAKRNQQQEAAKGGGVPATVLVPPPKDSSDYHYIPLTTQNPTTQSSLSTSSEQSVSLQEANLVYQESSSVVTQFKTKPASLITTSYEAANLEQSATTTHVTQEEKDSAKNKLPMPESYIEIEFPPQPPFAAYASLKKKKKPIDLDFVTLPVFDDYHHGDLSDNVVSQTHPTRRPSTSSHFFTTGRPPMTLASSSSESIIRKMQTMQPPPPATVSKSPPAALQALLHNEIAASETLQQSESKLTSSNTTATTTATTTPEAITTTSFTTDPLFKHYKQPTNPIKGPMYLIIQGHSKVKNFGPSREIHGIPVREAANNEVTDGEEDLRYPVKHLHPKRGFGDGDQKEANGERRGRSGGIQTLRHVVKTGLGAIDLVEEDGEEEEEESRSD